MKKTISRSLIYTMGVFSVFSATTPLPVSADWTRGLFLANEQSLLPHGNFVDDVIFNVLMWLLLIFTFLAVIAFVVNGIMFMLAGSSPDMAARAKRGVAYSIVGVAVGLVGYIMLAQINSFLTT